jgi:hypothetical protein
LIECAPSIQQILESDVGASAAENLPNFVEVIRQELAGEVQHERRKSKPSFLRTTPAKKPPPPRVSNLVK